MGSKKTSKMRTATIRKPTRKTSASASTTTHPCDHAIMAAARELGLLAHVGEAPPVGRGAILSVGDRLDACRDLGLDIDGERVTVDDIRRHAIDAAYRAGVFGLIDVPPVDRWGLPAWCRAASSLADNLADVLTRMGDSVPRTRDAWAILAGRLKVSVATLDAAIRDDPRALLVGIADAIERQAASAT